MRRGVSEKVRRLVAERAEFLAGFIPMICFYRLK